jgi:Cof subfamily protein (haloacid dehalogenase superfamily)
MRALNTTLRLLVCDLDGTLLEPDGSVSPRTHAALAALRADGVRVAIATGRIPRGIEAIVDDLELGGPQITMHGGLVVDLASGEEIYSATLSPDELDTLLAVATELALPTLLCYPAGFRTNVLTQEVIDLFVPYNEPLPELVSDLTQLRTSGPHKVAIWTGEAGYEGAMAYAADRLRGQFAITSGDNRSLELLPPGVNKARATVSLAAWMGVSREAIAAIGDGTNDIELLAAAGRSVAMRHARPEVRAAATTTIPQHLPDDAGSAISILFPALALDGHVPAAGSGSARTTGR